MAYHIKHPTKILGDHIVHNITNFQSSRCNNYFFIGKKPSQKHFKKNNSLAYPSSSKKLFRFGLGVMYSCRGTAVVANSGVMTLGLKKSVRPTRNSHSKRPILLYVYTQHKLDFAFMSFYNRKALCTQGHYLHSAFYPQAEKVPRADWERLGLWKPCPQYHQRVYISASCTPTRGEAKLFHTLMARTRVSVREAASSMVAADPNGGIHGRSDRTLESYIRVRKGRND